MSKGQSALRYALLGLLAGEPGTGYALKKRFAVELGDAWFAETSQIYPELARMVDDGVISEISRGARGSRVYAITDAGHDALLTWLKETEPQRASRNEGLMRLFFFFLLDDAESAELFEKERRYHREVLAKYEEWQELLSGRQIYRERFNLIVLEWGLRYERAFIEWLDWAEAEAKSARRSRGLSSKKPAASVRKRRAARG